MISRTIEVVTLSAHQKLAQECAIRAWVESPRRLRMLVEEMERIGYEPKMFSNDMVMAAAYDALDHAGVDGVLSSKSNIAYVYEEELEAAVLALWDVVHFSIPFGQFGLTCVLSNTPEWAKRRETLRNRMFQRPIYIRRRIGRRHKLKAT